MAKGRKLGKEMGAAAAAATAAAAAALTEDLIIEILVKLPVKSLLRFRCVCKSWSDIIKSPNFIEMHLKHHSNTKTNECILLIRNPEDNSPNFISFHNHETLSSISSLPELEIPHLNLMGFEVCGPCNGLICLADETNIVLCNPATREFKLLPLSPSLPCPDGSSFNRESIGFGFDSHTNDYKVVTFVYVDHAYKQDDVDQVEIYSLSTDTWVEYSFSAYPQHIEIGRCGTLYNGSFFWVAWNWDEVCILCYNMSNDVFSYMTLPERTYRQRCLRVINDRLAMLVYTEPYTTPEHLVVEVWVMHEFGVSGSTTKDFIIGPLNGIREPLMIWKDEALLMHSDEDQLVSCTLDTQEVNYFDIHGFILGGMVYQESLVSIN